MEGIRSLEGISPGDLYTNTREKDECRSAWRVMSLCEQPTITLVNLETGSILTGAVGCPNLAHLVRLVPE